MIPIKLLSPSSRVPTYSREGDAGVDLYSSEDCMVPAHSHRVVSAGIAIAIPQGHVGLIWDRSGLAAREGITTLAGVVDSNYRGEIRVVLANLGDCDIGFPKGSRIAQMLVQRVERVEFREVEELDATVRQGAGFGSSGR
jgi:dUTP pyrophosphatase